MKIDLARLKISFNGRLVSAYDCYRSSIGKRWYELPEGWKFIRLDYPKKGDWVIHGALVIPWETTEEFFGKPRLIIEKAPK